MGQSNSVTPLTVQVLFSLVKSVSGIDKCCEGQKLCIPFLTRTELSTRWTCVFHAVSARTPAQAPRDWHLLMVASEATTKDTGSTGASYATILLLYDSFSSRAKHMIFHANHVIYMSSEMKWKNQTSKEQRTYPLHRHNGDHNIISL